MPAKPVLFSAQENEKLVRLYFDYYNQEAWHKILDLYTASAVIGDPFSELELHQRDKDYLFYYDNAMHFIYDSLTQNITHLYAPDNQHILVELITTGTSIDKTIPKLEYANCAIFTLEKGKIKRHTIYHNNSK